MITVADDERHKQRNEPMRTRSKSVQPRQAEENAYELVSIWFAFTSDWLKRWRKLLDCLLKILN